MLKSLRLRNFRGFEDHTVEFTQFCLLVGQNNAGKTTAIEALRIIGLAQSKAAQAIFIPSPNWMLPYINGAVYTISLSQIDFDFNAVHHQYQNDDPIILTARLKNNCIIEVFIGSDYTEVYCQLREAGDKRVHQRKIAANPKFGLVRVMPPVGHLLIRETPINDNYVKKNLVSTRAHRHFRNQIYKNIEKYQSFKETVEGSWHGLQLGPIDIFNGENGPEYRLSVRDGPFVSEVGQQGSGLQAWLQTLWFLTIVPLNVTVVLDEPDVYLHADLQRKLLKILGSLGLKQSIIATHSVEMISDVSFEEVVLVKKRLGVSRALRSQDDLQGAADAIGSFHNLQLSKIASAGHVLFVEGKDKAYLSEIAYKLSPLAYDRFCALPVFPIGGFDNWPRAALTASAFYVTSSGKISSTIILDRDYKGDNVLDTVKNEAAKSHLTVEFWKKKEIENVLISSAAITRLINKDSTCTVDEGEVQCLIRDVSDSLALELEGLVAESERSANRKLSIPQALNSARQTIDERRRSGASNVDLVSGKALISRLSAKCQDRYNVSFNSMAICRALLLSECDEQIVALIESLTQHRA